MTQTEPFRFRVVPQEGMIEVVLGGYLDMKGARNYQTEVESVIASTKAAHRAESIGLLYLDELSGFQAGVVARQHGEWISRMKGQISGIAIVSGKTSVIMAMSIVKLLSKTPMQQFSAAAAARTWLAGCNAKK